jgi:hypothetical protein
MFKPKYNYFSRAIHNTQRAAACSALYRLHGEIEHLPTSNPMSRQHTHTGKNREERDEGYLTYRNERRRSRSREEEETAAPGCGCGRQQALGEVVTGSSSPWTPTAEAQGGNQRLVFHASPRPFMCRRELLLAHGADPFARASPRSPRGGNRAVIRAGGASWIKERNGEWATAQGGGGVVMRLNNGN